MGHHRKHISAVRAAVRKRLPSTILRELRRFASDGPQKILLFIVTPLMFFLFVTIYGDGAVHNLPVGICDDDNSASSRTVIRMMSATRTMQVIATVRTINELKSGIASGRFAGALYIPDRFEADIKSGLQVQPILIRDGTNYIASSFIARETSGILKMVGAGAAQSRLRKSGLDARHAYALISPVGADVSNMYNPIFSYLRYLAPGIIFSQFGMLVMISAGIAFAREREHASMPQLKYAAKGRAIFAFAGKSAPYFLVISIWTMILLLAALPLGNIADMNESIAAIPTVMLFLGACWCIGAAIGMVTGAVMLAAMVGVFVGMPSFIFSGWTFPLPAVPPVMAAVAQILPFTHFMQAWFESARMGLGPFSAVINLLALGAMILSGSLLSMILISIFWKKETHHRHGPSHPQTAASNHSGDIGEDADV